jgi:poly-gamma-glutamate capsule biosynthesis protein CapA/YwtB (metallophosphatase superfamily)
MVRNRARWWLLSWVLLLFMAGCMTPDRLPEQQTQDKQTPPTPGGTVLAVRPSPASPTLEPKPITRLPVESAVPLVLPEPSSTPISIITIAVPDSWRAQVLETLEQLNQENHSRYWQLIDGDQADIRLVKNDSGLILRESVLVLAVPFIDQREDVSLDQAEEILKSRHEFITVLPWSELDASQKALRIDGLGPADNDYPLRETWSLVSTIALTDAAAELAARLKNSADDQVVHLAAVGDIMLDRSLGIVLQQGDLTFPFSAVAPSLQGADLSVGNMESALGNSGMPQHKSYTFRAPPEAAASLASGGFDLVSLANNHGMDYGAEALLQAVNLLHEQGLSVVGAGENEEAAYAPAIFEVNGLRVAIFGFANVPVEGGGFDVASWTAETNKPGIAWAEPQIVVESITAVRDEVDLIVVLLHSGIEYLPLPSEAQQANARAAIDAGADLVIGHHAHILQGIEYYKDGVILYGTGNFAFDIIGPPESAIFHIWLDRDGVREIAIEPVIVQPGGRPRLAEIGESEAILNQIYQLTTQLAVR